MQVTMKDVAREAGVSPSTVSRVITGRTKVAMPKREAVERACRMLGYQPDGLAAALRNRASNSIGILVPDIQNPIFPAVIRAAEHELAQAAVDIMLCDAGNDPKIEAQRLQTLLRRRVDALLVCPVHVELSVPAMRSAARSVPLIQLDRHAIDEADFVGVDQTSGMNQVAAHLRSLGAQSAVFAGLCRTMSSLIERAEAFEAAGNRAGLTIWPSVELSFPDGQQGRAYARELLASKNLPDAIVCANDELAFGVLAELRDAGVRCPEDVLLVGHDDVTAAEYIGLTTVHQPLRDKGREAARLLQHQSDSPRHVRLTPTLVPRNTTAVAQSSHVERPALT